MDTVLIALLVMMVILFSVLTLTSGWLASQRLAAEAWDERQARALSRSATALRIAEASVQGGEITLTVENEGSRSLEDYGRWDLIVHCYTAMGQYRIGRLDHASVAPTGEEWDVQGIYADVSTLRPETYDPGILNPGEALVIRATLATPLDDEAIHLAVLGTGNGVVSRRQFGAIP
jgi:hypothetical protein